MITKTGSKMLSRYIRRSQPHLEPLKRKKTHISVQLCTKYFSSNVDKQRAFLHPKLLSKDVKAHFSTSSQEKSEPTSLFKLLNKSQRRLWESQMELSHKAKHVISQIPGTPIANSSDVDGKGVTVRESAFLDGMGISGLESTFSVVIAGEFNAGKSTFVNALLGEEVLESGALPTTDTITIVTNNVQGSRSRSKDFSNSPPGVTIITPSSLPKSCKTNDELPSIPILRDITLIDTPGTNTCLLDHTSRTLRLLPSADLILFVTSAERPLTKSEQNLIQSIQAYQKEIIVILNKMDILESLGPSYGKNEKKKVELFVKDQMASLFGSPSSSSLLFCVSARDALHAKKLEPNLKNDSEQQQFNAMWQRSQFGELEHYLKNTLSEKSKIKTKMMNPIGVTEGMILQAQETLEKSKKALETDISTLHLVLSQLEGWKNDMQESIKADFERDVTLLLEREKRIMARFLDEAGIWKLIFSFNSASFQEHWKATASSERPKDLDRSIQDLIAEGADMVASRATSQSEATLQYLGKRPSIINQNLIGSIHTGNMSYHEIRENVLTKTQKSVLNIEMKPPSSSSSPSTPTNTLIHFNPNKQALELFKSIQFTSTICGLIVSGSITTGALSYMEYFDLYLGGTSSFLVLVGSIFAFPTQIKNTKAGFKIKTDKANQYIQAALKDTISGEINKVHKQMVEGLDPYRRYVESEQIRVNKLLNECEDIMADSFRLKNKIQKMGYEEEEENIDNHVSNRE